jgi:hypothetical protein
LKFGSLAGRTAIPHIDAPQGVAAARGPLDK